MSKKQSPTKVPTQTPTEHEAILMALNDLCQAVSKLSAAQVVLVRTLVVLFDLGKEVEG